MKRPITVGLDGSTQSPAAARWAAREAARRELRVRQLTARAWPPHRIGRVTRNTWCTRARGPRCSLWDDGSETGVTGMRWEPPRTPCCNMRRAR